MKRTSKRPTDLSPEYDFDYSKSKPNRFAARMRDSIAVVLEPDVAAMFQDSRAVNDLLRSVIAALRKETAKKASNQRRRLTGVGPDCGYDSANLLFTFHASPQPVNRGGVRP